MHQFEKTKKVSALVKTHVIHRLPDLPSPKRYTFSSTQALPVQRDPYNCGIFTQLFFELWAKEIDICMWGPSAFHHMEYLRYRYLCNNLLSV